MRIIKTKTYEEMSAIAAGIIGGQVLLKPNCVLGLATGGTPVGAYAQLVEWYNKGDIDFSEVTTVNLDEYRGLPKEHPESYWSFMHRNLFDHVNIDLAHIHLPDGTNPDADDACAQYNQIIHSVGGIDLQLLGIGHDGHIGFNEPCDHFPVMTHEVQLTDMTREANKRFFNSIDEVPTAAITMGVGTVMAARKIVMVITGADKADILYKVFFGPVTPEVPGSILQFHSDVTLICDEAAAAKMPQEGQQCSI